MDFWNDDNFLSHGKNEKCGLTKYVTILLLLLF
jgi:hypothetical protein